MHNYEIEILSFLEECVRASKEAKTVADQFGIPFIKSISGEVKGDIYPTIDLVATVFAKLCDGTGKQAPIDVIPVVLGLDYDQFEVASVIDTGLVHKVTKMIETANSVESLGVVNEIFMHLNRAKIEGHIVSMSWSIGLRQCIIAIIIDGKLHYIILKVVCAERKWAICQAVRLVSKLLKSKKKGRILEKVEKICSRQ